MPTSLNSRLGPRGLVGSLGYRHVVDSHALEPSDVDRAAGTQFGQPDSTVGASVSFHF